MKGRTNVVVWLIGAAVFALFPAAGVWAHAGMTKSSPPNGATLTSSPAIIRAWFSEELASSGDHLRLYDAHDKLIASGGLDPKDSSHTALVLIPPKLGQGAYLVRWHVVAADDNAVTEGYFRFSIGGTAMGSSGTSAPPSLQLVAPLDHSMVKNPVAVVIETNGDIKELTMGSMGGMGGPGVHLHIVVDGVVTMPSSDQLTPAGSHRWQYLLAPLSRGTHTVKVLWAHNQTHTPASPEYSATFTVTQ